MNSPRLLVLLAATSLLAACQTAQPVRELPAPHRSPTVEGSWSDPHGLISTFSAGTFSTRTSDTNQTMATGTYTADPNGVIQISFYSNIKKTTSRANCQLATPNLLNCTSEANARFQLQRRSDLPAMAQAQQPLGGAPAPLGSVTPPSSVVN